VLLRSFRRSTDALVRNLPALPHDGWTVVRYEDLVADPRSELARLHGFLGLPPCETSETIEGIRASGRELEPHVAARIPRILKRTRLFRQTFGY
jgi:hypothetical protein